jgi:hypothetical protein
LPKKLIQRDLIAEINIKMKMMINNFGYVLSKIEKIHKKKKFIMISFFRGIKIVWKLKTEVKNKLKENHCLNKY